MSSRGFDTLIRPLFVGGFFVISSLLFFFLLARGRVKTLVDYRCTMMAQYLALSVEREAGLVLGVEL